MKKSDNKEKVFSLINLIPKGQVASYGMINELFNIVFKKNLTPLVVGYILSSMKEDQYHQCNWQRVVAKSGKIPALKLGFRGNLQIEILESEGVEIFDNKVDMNRYCIAINDLIDICRESKLYEF